jgi:hypothetical protein
MVRKKSYDEMLINDPIFIMKHIGPYFHQRLQHIAIYTAYDLLITLLELVDTHHSKQAVKQWLQNLTTNARPNQCLHSYQRVINRQTRSYLIRPHNFNTYNTIISFWRHHAPPFLRRYIPSKLRPRTSLARTFPTRCSTN